MEVGSATRGLFSGRRDHPCSAIATAVELAVDQEDDMYEEEDSRKNSKLMACSVSQSGLINPFIITS